MIINVTGQHLKMTEPIKQYAITKCSKVEKYLENIPQMDIVLSVNDTKSSGTIHKAVATVFASGKTIHVESESQDLYTAIDELSDKLERQVRKYKEKMQDKTQ